MVNTEIWLIIFFAAEDGEVLHGWQNKTRTWLWSDHELLIAKFRLKWKIVGKTTRPFGCDQNQIPYDYTVEVRNRFKGFDLIECLKNYGWRFTTLYRRQGSRHSQEKEMQKGKIVVWGGLTNSCEKKILLLLLLLSHFSSVRLCATP